MSTSAYSDLEIVDFLRRQVPVLLARLAPAQAPVWGCLTAQHMVEHLTGAVLLSTGQLGTVAAPPDSAGLAQKQAWLLNDTPFPRHLRNPSMAAVPGPLLRPSLPAAAATLLLELDGFFDFFARQPHARPVHMMLGALSYAHWQRFHFKHFAHHFLQFGLLPESLLPRPSTPA